MLRNLKVGFPEPILGMRMKTKPTRFAGWDGKNFDRPYPHAGIRQQQHCALMAGRWDMEISIGRGGCQCQTPEPLLAGGNKSFSASRMKLWSSVMQRRFQIR
jgi:hypothetical protein